MKFEEHDIVVLWKTGAPATVVSDTASGITCHDGEKFITVKIADLIFVFRPKKPTSSIWLFEEYIAWFKASSKIFGSSGHELGRYLASLLEQFDSLESMDQSDLVKIAEIRKVVTLLISQITTQENIRKATLIFMNQACSAAKEVADEDEEHRIRYLEESLLLAEKYLCTQSDISETATRARNIFKK